MLLEREGGLCVSLKLIDMTEVQESGKTMTIKETGVYQDEDIFVSDFGNEVYSIIDAGGTTKRSALSLGKGISALRARGVNVDKVVILPHDTLSAFQLDAVVLGKIK